MTGKQTKLTRWRIGIPKSAYSEGCLILLDGVTDRVLALAKEYDGRITFIEESDGFFSVTMTKEEAKKALLEALSWIENEQQLGQSE